MEPAVVAEAASLDALTASSLALHVRRRRRSKDTNEATGLGELLSYRTGPCFWTKQPAVSRPYT